MAADQALRKSFGATLRELREQKGLSQEQSALDAHLDRTYISLLERGLHQPSLSSLFSLAGALGVKASRIVDLTEKRLG